MKSIINIINILTQRDKLLHFIVGAFIFLFLNHFLDNYLSIFLVILIASFKELYDKFIKKTFIELLDIAMTILGGIFILLIKNIY